MLLLQLLWALAVYLVVVDADGVDVDGDDVSVGPAAALVILGEKCWTAVLYAMIVLEQGGFQHEEICEAKGCSVNWM